MAGFMGDDPLGGFELGEGDDLLTGLPEGIVDDGIRGLDENLKGKNQRLDTIDEDVKDTKDRMAVMVEHLNNVQQELVNTQQLTDAKSKEVETEDHLKQLGDREKGRVLQEISKLERKAFDLQDRLNITQNSIFRGNEKMDAFKLQMNWNQEEIEQWALAAKQKEEDNMALAKYSRADNVKIKEMNLHLEKLTKIAAQRNTELENEVTETQTAQIELDKTAEDFKQLHSERQELVLQWEQAIETMKRRDKEINETGEQLVDKKQDIAELRRVLGEKKSFLEDQVQENDNVERQTVNYERAVQRVRQDMVAERQAKIDLQDELDIVRNTLAKVVSELAMKRTQVANARDALDGKKERLELARRKLAEMKKRLENEYLATNDLEKSAQQIEDLNKEQDKALRATEKELAQLKQDMFRQSQELFALRKDEANLIAEISGAQTADRNLRDKIKNLDADSQKQQEHIYNADFALQQMERKVARAQGEYRADEKEALNAKVDQLEKLLTVTDQEERMLKKQLKKVNDDYRAAKRQVDELNHEKASFEDRIHELQLENDVVSRSLRNNIKIKEENIVQHDLLRLEVKKLRDKLNERADEVHGLTNRKFQLQKTMEERSLQIKAQKELLRADFKMAQEEVHSITMELRDRQMKASTLTKKFDLLSDKMNQEMGEGGERKSPAYYVVLRAQEREELQKEGDELDVKIQKAEREIRALENTLSKLTAKNDKLRAGYHAPSTGGADMGAKQELEAKLERLLERRRGKKSEADTLAADVQEMKARLANLRNEEDGMRRHIRLVQGKAQQFDKERQDLEDKRDRAAKGVLRSSKQLRALKGVEGDTEEELDFTLTSMREENKGMLHMLVGLAEEHGMLADKIYEALNNAGIAPPSRPASARSEVSSIQSDF